VKTLLHIAASPRLERSESRRLAKEFIADFLKKNSNYIFEEVNIGAILQPRFGEPGTTAKYKSSRGIAFEKNETEEWNGAMTAFNQLKNADRLVISTPMWNFSLPYHLKQWIDRVTQAGYTFGVDPKKGYYPMLGDKKTLVICAMGGVYDTPDKLALDHLRPYLRFWTKFNGLDATFVSLEGTNMGTDILAQNDKEVKTQLTLLAKEF
jgi:FMN-dependent NADH-azoreductase